MSGPIHVSRIDLAAFRGIERTLSIALGKRLTVIYGGNATGKSSVAQAVEFCLTGQVRDYEGALISQQYLKNTRAAGAGQVNLTLSTGAVLTATTDSSRSEIERAFRSAGEVDWPERQPLPITTTHITTQGMLARVLGSENAVTRNDLSGLCAGAYLRRLVSRAEQMATHFRQASAGRNIQTEIRDARSAYDTAKVLYTSLATSSSASAVSAAAIEESIQALNHRIPLAAPTTVDEALRHIDLSIGEFENRLQLVQRLLSRTRELGETESELQALSKQIEETDLASQALAQRRSASLDQSRISGEQLAELTKRRTHLLEAIAAHDRQQQATSLISAVEERAKDARSAEDRAREELAILTESLQIAAQALAGHANRIAELRHARQIADVRLKTVGRALAAMVALPPEPDESLGVRLSELQNDLAGTEQLLGDAKEHHQRAKQEEAEAASGLSENAAANERAMAAIGRLREIASDGHCPLCGHDHGERDKLYEAIDSIAQRLAGDADSLRVRFQSLTAKRNELETQVLRLAGDVARRRSEISDLSQTLQRQQETRTAAVGQLEIDLTAVPLPPTTTIESLRAISLDTEGKLGSIDQELRDALDLEREEERNRAEIERSVAAKSAERAQLGRLFAELSEQANKSRADLKPATGSDAIAGFKLELLEIDPEVATLERTEGQARAAAADLDRLMTANATQLAGARKKMQSVQALLASWDAELAAVGASRDPTTLVALEQTARAKRDTLADIRITALSIKQQQRTLEEARAVDQARQQLDLTQRALKELQDKQARLQQRSSEFGDLHQRLEQMQNATAEVVLESIRRPVGIVFQAMTAGCPWDIEFRLEDGAVHASLTDGTSRDIVATSVLNSAYVNVAAIALRLALAGQQRWTRLRTVVLDDPILEMDHLTQSALIDGLEAVLTSTAAPWKDLQFVITTWSEDFAVMAAHKLAHLNLDNSDILRGGESDNFLIQRLCSDPDGTIAGQRHIPKWRGPASAA